VYLSWIIPAYNEETRIEKTIREVDLYLQSREFPGGYEIIVADSRSTDRTREIVEKMQQQFPALKFLSLENRGKGWAVREGMRAASGEIRLFSDADNSVSVDHFGTFEPFLCGEGAGTTSGREGSQQSFASHRAGKECFDAVIGSIEVGGATIEEHAQWYRRILGKWSKYLIRIVSGLWEIHDTQRGFKVFTGRAARIIFPRQTIGGWGFDIEILLIAKEHGLRVKELPVRWVNPAGSKVRLGAYFSTLRELARIKLNARKGCYK